MSRIRKSIETESRSVIAGAAGSGNRDCLMGVGFPFGGDEYVSELDKSSSC